MSGSLSTLYITSLTRKEDLLKRLECLIRQSGDRTGCAEIFKCLPYSVHYLIPT